jgi:Cytochrome C assembly protein
MFDLEAAISQWRRQVESKWIGDQSALAELEDHLREEIAALAQSGHADEEAWKEATSKLGDPVAIGHEFSKIDRLPGLDRFAFVLILGAGVLALACSAMMLLKRGPRLVADPVLTIHVVTITLGYTVGLLAATIAGYGAIRGFLAGAPVPVLKSVTLPIVRIASLITSIFTVLGFTLGAVWANQEWGRPFSADPREIGAILVAISFAAATVTVWRSAMFARVSLAIAISGGGIILAAWFGVMAQASGYPALLTTIGFGGLIGSIALAAISLAIRDRPASS